MKAVRLLIHETREGFRLSVAWLIGFISFALLCDLTKRVILYFEPWRIGRTAHDEAELLLLWSVMGVGLLVIAWTFGIRGSEAEERARDVIAYSAETSLS
jgi:hypothetical protein